MRFTFVYVANGTFLRNELVSTKKPANSGGLSLILGSKINLSTFHVFPGTGINFNPFAGLDEKRGLNGDACLQYDWLLDVVGRITANSFRGIGNLQDDARRQLNGNGLILDRS